MRDQIGFTSMPTQDLFIFYLIKGLSVVNEISNLSTCGRLPARR
jgi:hypothetical protein